MIHKDFLNMHKGRQFKQKEAEFIIWIINKCKFWPQSIHSDKSGVFITLKGIRNTGSNSYEYVHIKQAVWNAHTNL